MKFHSLLTPRCMQLAVFYLAHKGILFLMLPLTYEGLADMKGTIKNIRNINFTLFEILELGKKTDACMKFVTIL